MEAKNIDIKNIELLLADKPKGLVFEEICASCSVKMTKKNRMILNSKIKYSDAIILKYISYCGKLTTVYSHKKYAHVDLGNSDSKRF
ncbi:hypothetical protein D929_00108 [Enterococcus faecalis 02-MB-P-10]|nr:hypothetical protein D929_00108 [Enterococcus faecalis 02-MB-P-10]